ncbi:MAG: ATP-binding protein [Ardenticatenales bacterium]|nr:ATP-binding protein [Ardenticatenales bacterium]
MIYRQSVPPLTPMKTGMTEASKDFVQQLKQALKHYHDAEWLGQHVPLAAPYFLGAAALSGERQAFRPPNLVAARGEALRRAVRQSANTLWGETGPANREQIEQAMPAILQTPGSPRYSFLVLELRYFHRFFKPRRLSQIWEEFLGQSRAEFYRDVDTAVSHLSQALLSQLRPTFRLEQPPRADAFIGREKPLRRGLEALVAGQSVALSGPGGVGKTTLAAVIAATWPHGAVFWFTVRPTLNDHLSSLLYSLGFFLHQQGADSLWQMLATDGGAGMDTNLALGLAREDLARLRRTPPLLCFDEVDRLRPPDIEHLPPAHAQLLEFLDSLRGLVPLLIVGQRAVVDTDVHEALSGLPASEIARMLADVDFPIAPADLSRLHEYTNGNPRLLRLFMALRQSPDAEVEPPDLAQSLARMADAPALRPLFDRLWLRTSSAERRLLQSLAVFRAPAPSDAWGEQAAAWRSLRGRGLLLEDGWGGVMLWPALRELLYAELSAELRERLHTAAAGVRAARGEYTAAAYHLWQAGALKAAVQLWFPRREAEIQRGQGAAALAIFGEISARRLGKREQRALALLRAELYQLQGEAARGLAGLEGVDWPDGATLTVSARALQGAFLEALGQPDAALASYEAGMAAALGLLHRLALLREQRARLFVRQRQMPGAWREARLAQYEAENLQGVVLAEQGRYADAYLSYQRALVVAESVGYDAGIARTHRDLITLLSRQGRLDDVIAHAEKAITYYDRIGDRLNRETVRSILSSTYIQTQQYDLAVQAAAQALPFFQRISHAHGIGATAANLAEGHYGLGNLAEARHYALLVLEQEEPFTHPYALFTLGLVARAQDRPDEATHAFAASADIAAQNEDRFMLAYARRAQAEQFLAQAQLAEAREAAAEAFVLFTDLGMAQEAAQTAELQRKLEKN